MSPPAACGDGPPGVDGVLRRTDVPGAWSRAKRYPAAVHHGSRGDARRVPVRCTAGLGHRDSARAATLVLWPRDSVPLEDRPPRSRLRSEPRPSGSAFWQGQRAELKRVRLFVPVDGHTQNRIGPQRQNLAICLCEGLTVSTLVCTVKPCLSNGIRSRRWQTFESMECNFRKRSAYSATTMRSLSRTMKAIRMSSGMSL